MKSIVAGTLASIAAMGLLAACGDDPKSSSASDATVIADAGNTVDTSVATDSTAVVVSDEVTVPPGATIPAGALPADVTIPQEVIDQMITQFEQAGMKVDKACFTNLLKDESLRKMVAAGGTPSQDVVQKFFTCLST
jgi:hypothetical protein